MSKGSYLVLGGMLFSMFFGAGNLILPPLLGLQAGTVYLPAMAGFLAAGIGLPVLAIIALAQCGSARALAGRVGPRFAAMFVALVYLTIGPFLAIPRTASTAFAMVKPLLPYGIDPAAATVAFSVVFFGVAFLLALHPGALNRVMGRFSAPLLIVLLVVVVASAVFAPVGDPAPPVPPYDGNALSEGFIAGYQTTDLLAALCFGIVVTMNAKALGARESKSLTLAVSVAGVIAGVLMGAVYCGIGIVGVQMGSVSPGATNGAELLSATCQMHFGPAGAVLVAAIFLLACLNVCIALVSCCAEYFYEALPRFPLAAWAAVFAVSSCLVSLLGLDAILAFSVPLLNALYPPAIVLVLMGLVAKCVDRVPKAWAWAVGCTGVASVLIVASGLLFADGQTIVDALPFASLGFGWVVPALVGAAIGVAVSLAKRPAAKEPQAGAHAPVDRADDE
ncbi:branched-chain amino acid transport system II carrier protein [Xiamenia xianingshaonis]|uniref:branched-chain amino acid transport system II carrier protein n=1 Tax=Xiamenia xianingshaonis TaxID=2682776 RepID=UPI0021BD127C|nr:branched-chain amino acid transport system II carrier protein [Xiamenia xianingshaonis]